LPRRTRRRLTLLALSAAALCVPAALPAVASAENYGDIIVNEFRTHGPGGAPDEYLELKNQTSSPINLRPSGSNRMWTVEYWVPDATASGGGYWEYFFFDVNRTIPAKGRLLLVNKNASAGTGYSLDAYRPGDLVYNPAAGGLHDIPADDTGIILWSDVIYDVNFNLSWDASSLNVDEVGYSADPAGFGVECDPFPANPEDCPGVPSPGATTSSQFAFVRKAATGVIQDGDNNHLDFELVGLNGQALLNGLNPIMGAPGPQGLGDPLENFAAGFFRLDTTKTITQAPNRVYDPTPAAGAENGFLYFNREVKNNTGAPINTLKIRWIDLTTENSPGSENTAQAILKPVSAATSSTVSTAAGNKTVRGAQLDAVPGPPATTQGGLNSSMTVPLLAPVPNGGSVNIQIKVAVKRNGTFRASWWPEVK
jgi:hypothetical protein